MSSSKKIICTVSLLLTATCLSTPAFAQLSGNVLTNSGFENDAVPSYGNNINVNQSNQPTGWKFGGGSRPNIVKMDGPGGQAEFYGRSGPHSDATNAGAGVKRHYLDITNGRNDFYQSFTPKCSGKVVFGGYFATRENRAAQASVKIVRGSGLNGQTVGQSNALSLPRGNSKTDPWVFAEYTTNLQAGQTYSFVVSMDNNSNFDEGFVKFTDNCRAYPPDLTLSGSFGSVKPGVGTIGSTTGSTIGSVTTGTATQVDFGALNTDDMLDTGAPANTGLPKCCSPWDESVLQSSLKYKGSGSIMDLYTLPYAPDASVNQQMEAYINYLNALDPGVTSITVHFRLWDKGQNPGSPGLGSQVGQDHFVTWTAGGSSAPSNGGGNFFNQPRGMKINNWYCCKNA